MPQLGEVPVSMQPSAMSMQVSSSRPVQLAGGGGGGGGGGSMAMHLPQQTGGQASPGMQLGSGSQKLVVSQRSPISQSVSTRHTPVTAPGSGKHETKPPGLMPTQSSFGPQALVESWKAAQSSCCAHWKASVMALQSPPRIG